MTFKLRPYQQEAVDATLRHFRESNETACIVLPTGAGKSLVIAELARVAQGKILVLAHVKELCAQNHQKYELTGNSAGIFSAGLERKETHQQVIFASVQSVAPNLSAFDDPYSLVIVDECHRLNAESESQYGRVFEHLRARTPNLKILGLTATPYRMGLGWIYRYHCSGVTRSDEDRPFVSCIYELSLRRMIEEGYLTRPEMVDAPIAQYNFSVLGSDSQGEYVSSAVNNLLVRHQRVTESIIEQVVDLAETRQGVMIFAATVEHAKEIAGYLPAELTALVLGETSAAERDQRIGAFKQKKLKYLVNVSVLTTGFDAPHVDLIAILRPTQSVSLFQQIVGRGLRLSEDKSDCLVIDYAGNGFSIYSPEVGATKPNSESVAVSVVCPRCEYENTFWGLVDSEGHVVEHYGRRCQALRGDESPARVQCEYRFRFKECQSCMAENDIAARRCHQCDTAMVDPDDQLKRALSLKDAKVLRVAGMTLAATGTKLAITYHDEGGHTLVERFDLQQLGQRAVFNQVFGRRLLSGRKPMAFTSAQDAERLAPYFAYPDFVVARKVRHYWQVRERVFDYQGRFRRANQER